MEQDKECISVEQAATEATKRLARALAIKPDNQQDCDYLEGYNKGYVHGAQWQKEQLNKLLHLINQAINELELCGAIHLANLIEKEVNKL